MVERERTLRVEVRPADRGLRTKPGSNLWIPSTMGAAKRLAQPEKADAGSRARYVARIFFPDRRESSTWRQRTKLPVLYAPENKHRSTSRVHDRTRCLSLLHG